MSRVSRILLSQYSSAIKESHPNLSIYMNPTNVKEWFFLIKGLEYPYLAGEYIFKLTAPKLYPAKPPKLEFMTENGMYSTGGPVCISIGEYHSDDPSGKDGSYGWRPALGMLGFAVQVINGMICSELMEGVRIQNSPDSLKVELALRSRQENMTKYPHLMAMFV